jgi:hypothetical protein
MFFFLLIRTSKRHKDNSESNANQNVSSDGAIMISTDYMFDLFSHILFQLKHIQKIFKKSVAQALGDFADNLNAERSSI